ncbi:tripartite tricarboxylate transporter permease [Candidatus Woesearchaeota archaeon]|nr:tripartite tricarboxylate transporter permease [Candidatus Woesearchaeota archaeon]
MFTQIIIAIFLGILAGIITGLTPGIHINLISAILVASSIFLLRFTEPITLAVFIISMSVIHTFLDTIPSVFLGAPDSATALGVLPGHRFLLKGQGLFAVKLTIIGSFFATIISIIFFPLFVIIISTIYPLISPFIKYFIVAIVLFMILKDRHKIWATIIFAISGILGLLSLNINLTNPLFPLLSGMFGISTLLYSLKDKNNLPQQAEKEEKIPKPLLLKALASGCFSGYLTAVTPALGSGMAAVISSQITRKLGDIGFMILIGSISTFNMILSLVTFYVLDKARNGSIIALQSLIEKINFPQLIVILASVLIAGSIAVFLALNISRIFCKFITRVNYTRLILVIIMFIVSMTILLSGWKGMIILMTSTAVGLIPAIKKTTRTMGMGCLIVPVLSYFF